MDLSVFLAKVLGLYLVILSIAMLWHGKRFKGIVTEIDNNPALLLLSGIIPLILGSLLVVSHSIWEADWRFVITVIGWLAFLKGIVRVTIPQLAIRFDAKFMKQKWAFKVCSVVVLLLGLYLCYSGFII